MYIFNDVLQIESKSLHIITKTPKMTLDYINISYKVTELTLSDTFDIQRAEMQRNFNWCLCILAHYHFGVES